MIEYGLYKGDTFLDVGTAEELAKKFNVKPNTIKFYATPTWKSRFNEDDSNRLISVKIIINEDE